jgi:hypothetical protein
MKRFLLVVAVALSLVVLFAPAGQAASPAQDCANAGGTYYADGPNSRCVIDNTEPAGNSDVRKGTTTTETGPGKSEPNSETTSCTGVTNPSGSHCK